MPGDELVLVVADLLALGLVVRVLVLRVVLLRFGGVIVAIRLLWGSIQ